MDGTSKFTAAKNFALYYGLGREDELAGFDVAIVEPAGQSELSVIRMQKSGTLVLAYLSIMEISPTDPQVKMLKTEDFLYIDGQPVINREYGNYLLDLRSRRWLGLLFHRVGKLIIQSGYDGLFLDTIGDVESAELDSGARDLQLMAAVDFIRRIRSMYPSLIMVQNCGLERLCFFSAEYVNGICWENPPLDKNACRPWVETIINQLKQFKKKYGTQVLLLLEGKGGLAEYDLPDGMNYRMARRIAEKNDFLLYRAPFRYVTGVNHPEGD